MSENSKSVTKKTTAKKTVVKKTVKKQAVRKQAVRGTPVKKQVAKKKVAARAAVSEKVLNQVSNRERYEMVARVAYFRAEKRGFEPGWEQEDWYASEKVVDEMLNKGS